jgi:hypothetical protein
MPAFYLGSVIFAVVALIAAVFSGPINKEMAEVEEHSSGHNAAH